MRIVVLFYPHMNICVLNKVLIVSVLCSVPQTTILLLRKLSFWCSTSSVAAQIVPWLRRPTNCEAELTDPLIPNGVIAKQPAERTPRVVSVG